MTISKLYFGQLPNSYACITGVNITIISNKLDLLQAETFKEFLQGFVNTNVILALLKTISMDALQSFCKVPKIRKSQITAFFMLIELILITIGNVFQ